MRREVFREATGYYRVDLTGDMSAWVEQRLARWSPANYKNMTSQERGTRAGITGEAIFQWAIPRAKCVDGFAYDFVLDGFTVEIKTHITRSPPTPQFFLLIPCEKVKNSDTYGFVSLHESMNYGWLVGWLQTKEIKVVGSFRKKGQRQLGTNFEYKCDCWEIPYERLRHFKSVDVA